MSLFLQKKWEKEGGKVEKNCPRDTKVIQVARGGEENLVPGVSQSRVRQDCEGDTLPAMRLCFQSSTAVKADN